MISINDLQPQLEVLKSVFPLNERQNELFDEFVREHEFGLALHIVCDHILESNSGAVDKTVIDRIQQLHSAMGIDDDCVGAIVKNMKK